MPYKEYTHGLSAQSIAELAMGKVLTLIWQIRGTTSTTRESGYVIIGTHKDMLLVVPPYDTDQVPHGYSLLCNKTADFRNDPNFRFSIDTYRHFLTCTPGLVDVRQFGLQQPHKAKQQTCPLCGGNAFFLAVGVECETATCRNYKVRGL